MALKSLGGLRSCWCHTQPRMLNAHDTLPANQSMVEVEDWPDLDDHEILHKSMVFHFHDSSECNVVMY